MDLVHRGFAPDLHFSSYNGTICAIVQANLGLVNLTHRRRGTFTRGRAMTLILPTNSEVYLNFTY